MPFIRALSPLLVHGNFFRGSVRRVGRSASSGEPSAFGQRRSFGKSVGSAGQLGPSYSR